MVELRLLTDMQRSVSTFHKHLLPTKTPCLLSLTILTMQTSLNLLVNESQHHVLKFIITFVD